MVDALAQELGVTHFRDEHKAKTAKVTLAGEPALLVKPQTFMNLSGDAVRPIMDFYKVELKDLLVLQDEVDIPFAAIRFHVRRGHGGHNGIRHLHQMLGTDDYARLKLGVGRPADPRFSVADYVLANFNEPESDLVRFVGDSCDAVMFWVRNGVEKAANKYNGSKKE